MEAHKSLLAHNITFICYSVLTGVLSHLKVKQKTLLDTINQYNLYYQTKLAIKEAKWQNLGILQQNKRPQTFFTFTLNNSLLRDLYIKQTTYFKHIFLFKTLRPKSFLLIEINQFFKEYMILFIFCHPYSRRRHFI